MRSRASRPSWWAIISKPPGFRTRWNSFRAVALVVEVRQERQSDDLVEIPIGQRQGVGVAQHERDVAAVGLAAAESKHPGREIQFDQAAVPADLVADHGDQAAAAAAGVQDAFARTQPEMPGKNAQALHFLRVRHAGRPMTWKGPRKKRV